MPIPPPPHNERQVSITAKFIIIVGHDAREMGIELEGSRWGRSQPDAGEQIDGLPDTGSKFISLLISHEMTDLFEGFVSDQITFVKSQIRVSYGDGQVPMDFFMEQSKPWRVNRRSEYTLVQMEFDSVTKSREGDEE